MDNNKSATVLKLGDRLFISKKKAGSEISGSVYMSDKLNPKSLIMAGDGKKYSVPFLRFNLMENRFDAKMTETNSLEDNGEYFVFDNKTIDHVIINNRKFVKINDKSFEKPQFMELLYEAKEFKFLKSFSAKIQSARVDALTKQQVGTDMIVHSSKYYIEGEELKKIKLKKKYIHAVFGDKKSEMIAFIKKNNLSLSKEKDLVEIFKFLDQL